MRRNLYLAFAGLILAFAAWNSGGVVKGPWIFCVAALSVLASVYWLAEPVSHVAWGGATALALNASLWALAPAGVAAALIAGIWAFRLPPNA